MTRDDPLPRSVGGVPVPDALAEGYRALLGGDWDGAIAFFRAAGPTAEALEGLGLAASQAGDGDLTIESREAAWEQYRRRGDDLGSARVARALVVDYATTRGHVALANGWLQRAHTLLSAVPEAPEHGWLQSLEAEKAMILDNDCDAAEAHASRAVDIARRHADRELEAQALASLGIAQVTSGRVQEGLGRLDQAGTACLTGEVRAPWVVASILCLIMDACDRARDWERAQEWFGHVQRLAQSWNDVVLHAQCRPHYAVVLTWRGAWAEAERELEHVIDELLATYRPIAVEGIVRLAELRWRQGRYEDAASLFEQVKHEPLAQLGQAVLALEEPDPERAMELVQRCLRRLPASDRLERLPALEIYIRTCLATGDCDQARTVLAELEDMLSTVSTRTVRATVQLSMGLIAAAEGNAEAARAHLDDAVSLYEQTGAPFEAARSRVELARSLLALGRSDEAAREAGLALDTFRSLGARREAERAEALLRPPAAGPSPAAGVAGLTARETQVLRLLAGGHSNQEIADLLVLSVRTVQRHVENIYAKTGARGRAAAAVFAATHNLTSPDET